MAGQRGEERDNQTLHNCFFLISYWNMTIWARIPDTYTEQIVSGHS